MEAENTTTKRKILIVDDIAFNRTVLQKILKKEGYDLHVAVSGEQCVEVVKSYFPDLILLDFMMPGMDGLEVIRFLKKDPKFRNIPVMFLTASDEMESMTDAFDAGAVDYITKPFKAAELNARVSTQIRQLDAAQEIEERIQEQQELIHILAHDLRNPMVACRGLIELMEEGDAAVEVLGPRIRQSLQKCLDTIELVRKKGLLEAEVSDLNVEPLDLKEQAEMVIADYNESLADKGLVVENNIADGIFVMAEKNSLNNVVLANLISNAIKFSYPVSSIELKALDLGDFVELSIIDKGMGIPSNLLPIIFEPKKVTRREGTMNEQGTGYGMGLVKKLIHLYKGSIRIESIAKSVDNRNHGTKVIITFKTPLVETAAENQVAASAEA